MTVRRITRLHDILHKEYKATATTGIAALQVGGVTLHSFASVGLGEKPVLALLDQMGFVLPSIFQERC